MSAVLAHLPIYLKGAFGLDIPPGGVDLFFVISGYIMVYTSFGVAISPRKFMARRIVRIVPLYWAVTLFVFSVAFFAPHLVQSTSTDIGELLKSLFFIPFAKTNGQVMPTLFVGWTLNIEMAFYLLFAASMLIRNKVLRYGLMMASITAIALWGKFTHPENPIVAFLTEPLLLNFVFGMAIGIVTPHLPKYAPKLVLAAVLALGAAGMAVQLAAPVMFPWVSTAITCGLPSSVLIAALVIAERWGWRITSPTIILLGEATYAIYLTHPFVTSAMEKVTAHMFLGQAGYMFAIITTLSLAALVGVLVHRYVELPLNNLARRVRLPGHMPSSRPHPTAPLANG